mmetsp:Transcript_39531/g.88752  ORF Transcript_39531/g.88752 Transcript_39531/m.88752 type:complete len:546 (-) Transcript_39531:41-1678(-)
MQLPWVARRESGLPEVKPEEWEDLRRFAAAPRLQRAVFRMVAQTLTSHEVDDFADAYLALAGCAGPARTRQNTLTPPVASGSSIGPHRSPAREGPVHTAPNESPASQSVDPATPQLTPRAPAAAAMGVITRESLGAAADRSGMDIPQAELDGIFAALVVAPTKVGLGFDGQPLHRLEVENEGHFNNFVAAMMRRKIRLHESRARAAFEMLNPSSSGFVDAGDLAVVFGDEYMGADMQTWISEVDFKGNGLMDWEEFVFALQSPADATPLEFLPLQERPRINYHARQLRLSKATLKKLRPHRLKERSDGGLTATSSVCSAMDNLPPPPGRSPPGKATKRRHTADVLPGRVLPEPIPDRRTLSQGDEPWRAWPTVGVEQAYTRSMMSSLSRQSSSCMSLGSVASSTDTIRSTQEAGEPAMWGGHLITFDESHNVLDTTTRAEASRAMAGINREKMPLTRRGWLRRAIRTGLRTHRLRRRVRRAAGGAPSGPRRQLSVASDGFSTGSVPSDSVMSGVSTPGTCPTPRRSSSWMGETARQTSASAVVGR